MPASNRDKGSQDRLASRIVSPLLLVFALAAPLHFYRLDEPRAVIFDEVHFGGFVNAYCCTGEYFFDIHPPHAKLIVAGAAAVLGYRGDQSFANINEPMDATSPLLFRIVPALAGSLIPVLVCGFLLQLGASRMAALLAGFAIALENGLLVQTRLLALDGILIAATLGAVMAAIAAMRATRRLRRTHFALASGALCGLAVGCKFTGLAALGIVGAFVACEFLRAPSRERLRSCLSLSIWILTAGLAVYALGWLLHGWLLPAPGPGWAFMRPSGRFLSDVLELHRVMFGANYGLESPHPYSSPWWSWLLMGRSVFYWASDQHLLYFLGNPVVWWGTSLGLVVLVATVALIKTTKLAVRGAARPWPPLLWIPALAYAITLLPLLPVPRALFLYHYLSPLVFAVCTLVLWIDHLGFTRPGSWRMQRPSYYAALGLLVLGFFAVSPLSFSFLDLPDYQGLLFERFPRWR